VTFPIITDESKEESSEIIVETVWDMFYNYRPQPSVQIISSEVAEEFYCKLNLNIRDLFVTIIVTIFETLYVSKFKNIQTFKGSQFTFLNSFFRMLCNYFS
jgi:hypothetical protein